MKPADIPLYNDLQEKLRTFKFKRPLPGIENPQHEDCFIRQVIDSVRRVKYVRLIAATVNSPLSTNPANPAFNPLKAAVWHKNHGNIDEAFWLIFLATHFGKNSRTNWNLVRDVYSGLTNNVVWDWETICANTENFKQWLDTNQEILKLRGKVGNHRKYQSLAAYNENGTGAAISSYIDWIGPDDGHQRLIDNALEVNDNDSKRAFNYMYNSMDVRTFGRMAKFDYLTMVGKLGLVNIAPDSTYMVGATGPVYGARILFGQNVSNTTFDEWLSELEDHLELDFGMQVLEDAICNWQKNVGTYIHFKG